LIFPSSFGGFALFDVSSAFRPTLSLFRCLPVTAFFFLLIRCLSVIGFPFAGFFSDLSSPRLRLKGALKRRASFLPHSLFFGYQRELLQL